jgi:hypothetical protein
MQNVASATLLWGNTGASGPYPVVTCPAGYTLLVKTLSVTESVSAPANFSLWLRQPGSGFQVPALSVELTAKQTLHVATWHVLEAGCSLLAYSTLGQMGFWVSGSILTGEPPDVLVIQTLEHLIDELVPLPRAKPLNAGSPLAGAPMWNG